MSGFVGGVFPGSGHTDRGGEQVQRNLAADDGGQHDVRFDATGGAAQHRAEGGVGGCSLGAGECVDVCQHNGLRPELGVVVSAHRERCGVMGVVAELGATLVVGFLRRPLDTAPLQVPDLVAAQLAARLGVFDKPAQPCFQAVFGTLVVALGDAAEPVCARQPDELRACPRVAPTARLGAVGGPAVDGFRHVGAGRLRPLPVARGADLLGGLAVARVLDDAEFG
jgi:hypothetical protein